MNLPSTAVNVSWRPPQRSPHRLATGIFFVYLFLLTSRLVEMLPPIIGVNLRLTLVLMIVSGVAAIFTGGLLESLRTPVVMMFTVLTGWLMLAVFPSRWRGGSVILLTGFWITSYSCAVLVPSLISTLDQCRKTCYLLGFALIPMLISTVVFQQDLADGRDRTVFGTLANPNDLAFSLLLLLPFAVFVVRSESIKNWKAIACVLAIVFALVKTLRTGSRAGMLCIVMCFAILIISGRMKTKIAMLGLAGLTWVLALAAVSDSLLLRYTTVFNGTSSQAEMSAEEMSAVASTQARKMLLEESIRMMLENPCLGSVAEFSNAALATDQRRRGEHETWREAHNSYTQLGSEAGMPALAIYLAIVIYCLKRTIWVYRRTRDDPSRLSISRMAASLTMALIIFVICAAFGTYSYSFHFPVLAGLVQSFDVCARRDLNKRQASVRARQSPRPFAPMPTPMLAPRTANYMRNSRLNNGRG